MGVGWSRVRRHCKHLPIEIILDTINIVPLLPSLLQSQETPALLDGITAPNEAVPLT